MVSFSSYQAPGVYVQGTAATVVNSSSIIAPVVTIVAPALGYISATDQFPISLTAHPLANTGVLTGVVVALASAPTVPLTPVTDYTISYGSGATAQTTITLVGSSPNVNAGDVVIATYTYQDATYFAPKVFTDINSVEAVYGQALLSGVVTPGSNQVNSPLSMAATTAFHNGAATVLCVAVAPPVGPATWVDSFNAALSQIATNPQANLLVPVFAQPAGMTATNYTALAQSLGQAVLEYVNACTNNGFGRVAFVGGDTLFTDEIVLPQTWATALHSSRVVEAWPFRMQYYNAGTQQTTEIGGCYLAAAYAGLLSAQVPSRGLTRLQVFGFVGIPSDLTLDMTTSFLNALSSGGVCVTQIGSQGQLQIRHGVSTDPSNIVTQEVSITRGFDLLYQSLSVGIDAAGLIGQPITPDTTSQVSSIVAGILETALQDQVIANYFGLSVTQESLPLGNPSAVDVTFTYEPFIPMNYIVVSFSMDLTNGQVVPGSTTNTDTTDTNIGN